MDYKIFISGIKNILLDPVKAWEIIDSENKSVKVVRDSYIFPLIILVSASAITGSLIFTNTELSPVYSIFVGIKHFVLLFFTIYATAIMLGEITFPLDLGKDFSISFRLIVYSLTPLFLCQIVSQLFESLIFVNILALYGIYIFWTGAEKMLNPPDYKKMPMLIAIFVVITGFFFGGNWVLTSLIDRIYYSFFA